MLTQELDKRECDRSGIHENHGGEVALRVEEGVAAEAPGGAVVHVDAGIWVVYPGQGNTCFTRYACSKALRLDYSFRKRSLLGMQLGLEKAQHVARRGADASGTREHIQLPGRSRPTLAVVALQEAAALFG